MNSNVKLDVASALVSKNSPSTHTCDVTGTPSVNNLTITYTNINTPTNDIILPNELT